MEKRKAMSSDLKGPEVANALRVLNNLRDVILREQQLKQEADCGEGGEKEVLEKLGDLISLLDPEPFLLSFSDATLEILRDKLNITPQDELIERRDRDIYVGRVSAFQGGDRYMSSKDMHSHLNLLENLMPKTEANARLWVDAIFFRVSAMLPNGKGMVLNLKHGIPAVTIHTDNGKRALILSGTIDYTAVVVHEYSLLQSPDLKDVWQKAPYGIFVTKVTLDGKPLVDHVPEVIAGMYGVATFLRKGVIRGAVSNGSEWLLIILSCNQNQSGGSYRLSPVLRFWYPMWRREETDRLWSDTTAGILSYWVEHSFDDLDDNDWFA